VLQQRRSAAATRATALRACSAIATRTCTAITPRCHRHRHKAHGRAVAWWLLTLRCRFPSVDFRPRISVRRTSCILSCVLRPVVLRPTSSCPTPYYPTSCRPAILRPTFSSNIYLTSVQYLCVTGYSQQRTLFFKLCVVLEFCSYCCVLSQHFRAWDNTMSSDDESTTARPEPRYQLRSNTQSFEPISLSSRSSRRYHQASTTPPSSSTTPTRNSGSGYTTSTIHQSPFGGAH
jgi:hypothetical protein